MRYWAAMATPARLPLPRRTLASARAESSAGSYGPGATISTNLWSTVRRGATRALYGVDFSHEAWDQFNYPNNWLLPKDPSKAAEDDSFASLGTRCEVHQADDRWPLTRPSGLGVGGFRIVLGFVVSVILLNTLELW